MKKGKGGSLRIDGRCGYRIGYVIKNRCFEKGSSFPASVSKIFIGHLIG